MGQTLYLEMRLFVDLLSEKKTIPSQLQHIASWYDDIKLAVRYFGKKIMDIEEQGKHLYGRFNDKIAIEDYMRIVRQLAMFEFLMNYEQWPEFQTVQEKQEIARKETSEVILKNSEKIHFEREYEQLGDAREDIAGASIKEVRFDEIPLSKKGKEERRRRLE